MSDTEAVPPDLHDVVAGLRAQVEARRRAGQYPEGLEEDLDAHFHRMVLNRSRPADVTALREAIDRLRALPGLARERIPIESNVPGGRAMHQAVAKAVGRQVQGILEQVQQLSLAVQDALEQVIPALSESGTHIHSEPRGQMEALQDRLAALERGPETSPAGFAELSRRLERLERAEAERQFRAPFTSGEFEDSFRGGVGVLRERYRDLAQRFVGHSPVLDVGCGRGEFIELLQEAGIEASGVELDERLAFEAVAAGLPVRAGDGLGVLGEQADSSLGGLSLIQVIEHLSRQGVVNLVSLAADKVRPGGLVVVETVNPQSLYVFARAFYLDPTHDRPVHPGYLTFLFRAAGFSDVYVEWRSMPPEAERLAPTGDPAADANVERLNDLVFGPQDYAVIATR